MKFDLHLHTTRHSPDSQMDPLVMVRRAREIGLDGVVITEHDWLWTEPELEGLRGPAKGLVVAAGAGLVMDMTDRVFANVAVGYQVGFQTVSQMGMSVDNNSRYLRVALGGGVRF